jgi:hypothetical protein
MTLNSNTFSGQNLNGRDFSNQDLNGCDFSGQDLSKCKFTHTKMNGAILKHSNLNGAILEQAQLSGANLTHASLRGANLSKANLKDAFLEDTDFSGADVEGTLFKGSKGLSEKIKRDLKARGGIFDDDSITIDRKWWIEKVFIPLVTLLIGSGGIIGIWQLLRPKLVNPESTPPIENTQKLNSNNSIDETIVTSSELPLERARKYFCGTFDQSEPSNIV